MVACNKPIPIFEIPIIIFNMKKIATFLFFILSLCVHSNNTKNNLNLPPVLTLNYSATNPTCPGLNNGAVYATVTGGNLPLSNFTLTNGANVLSNATGIFLDLAPGNYTLSISDFFSLTDSRNVVITAPNDLTVSSPTTICSGTPTNLLVSGSTTSYLWTANPADSSLTSSNNTSATPTVSPVINTTYTVTSTSNSPSSNMVSNGDFSLGNTGFTSGYSYVANAGGGAQGIYGVVTTATSWFQFFAACNIEHTTGSGKMMIFDGSTSNAGNDKAWGQTIAVQPNKIYTFSYWVQTVALPNPANLELKINGVVVGTDLAPTSECSWSLRTYTWNSGTATTADIALYDKVILGDGNDFAIDDISFTTNVICNLSKSVVITVAPRTTTTFNQVNPICSGSVLTLPSISTNTPQISGAWSPAVNNTATTIYTFTPSGGVCASTATMTVTVNPIVTPTFVQIADICSGDSLVLPLTSTNIPQISGTWTPAPNNLATTTYTFTSANGQCATNGSMIVNVKPNITPTFSPISDICSGAALSPLPTTSINLINGNWSPALDNSATTNYVFTPISGQCSSNTSLTINVSPFPQFSITEGCDGTNFVLSAIGIGTTNVNYIWYDNIRQNIGTSPSITINNQGNYSLELSNNGCSEEKQITVTNILCGIPKGISPNGDGDNDSLDLSNLNVQHLKIFNRHGLEVFSKMNYTNEWTGKSNSGVELPDGTYYYMVHFSSGKTNTGWIYINK